MKHKVINMKMKRIAFILLSAIAFVACRDEQVGPDDGGGGIGEFDGGVSLSIRVPKGSVSTYASENASAAENIIDSIYVILSQGGTPLPIRAFGENDQEWKLTDRLGGALSDSTVFISYEEDGITAGTPVDVTVYANYRAPKTITGEIVVPQEDSNHPFFMSSATGRLHFDGTSYTDTVSITRNVAKLRVNISEHAVMMPEDLVIDYKNVKIEVLRVPNQTTIFGGSAKGAAASLSGFSYINYTPRTDASLRPINNNISTFSGGQIDSLYLYENYFNTYSTTVTDNVTAPSTAGVATQVKVTIPTKSMSEGNKTADYTYPLYTNNASTYDILRNHIYILDIKVRGQSLEPVITLDIKPWNDVAIQGNINGTYLTTDVSEIMFNESDSTATINFCTDAQAIYFNFEDFNNANGANSLSLNAGSEITAGGGIVAADPSLAPNGFKDGQILLDKEHCGSFTFKLNPNGSSNYSGSICMRAGGIVKCFTFPGTELYDAHFIVGEELSGGPYTSATVDASEPGWLEVSRSRLYTGASNSLPNAPAAAVFLHLNENLTGITRSGSVTLYNGSNSTKIYIKQLPAIKVGRFGYDNKTGDVAYDAGLYTEQMFEYNTLVQYANIGNAGNPPANMIYNGLGLRTGAALDLAKYNDATFNYRNAKYSAINYCMYKNRASGSNGQLVAGDIKWYLPAQAQLMGMWLSYESYKNENSSLDSTFAKQGAISYWAATANNLYENDAQYMNFSFGNVGHTKMFMPDNKRFYARCVRDGRTASAATDYIPLSMVNNASAIDFSAGGMPAGSFTTTKKGQGTGTEKEAKNATLYHKLLVDNEDLYTNVVRWDSTACSTVKGADWRLPTQRELQAIWILQREINTKNSSNFKLLKDDEYYWSATEASETKMGDKYTNAWVVWGSITNAGDSGNTPHRPKSEFSRMRCVKEN